MLESLTDESEYYHWTIDREVFPLLISRRGFTPYSLAFKSGVNKRVIYQLLSGERRGTTYPTVEALARVLDVDLRLFADPSMRFVNIPRALKSV